MFPAITDRLRQLQTQQKVIYLRKYRFCSEYHHLRGVCDSMPAARSSNKESEMKAIVVTDPAAGTAALDLGSIASAVTAHRRSPATRWPAWSLLSAMERRGCRWDSECSASRTQVATSPMFDVPRRGHQPATQFPQVSGISKTFPNDRDQENPGQACSRAHLQGTSKMGTHIGRCDDQDKATQPV